MLPSLAELRERSRFHRDAAREATDTETRRRHAACAFLLAQIAEAIERDKEGAQANAVQLARMIADAVAAAGGAPPTAIAREINHERSRISGWRMRAEELRATADRFNVPSAQASLRRAAENYERRADIAEAVLEGKPTTPDEKAG
jgi:hypothetical protein